MFSVVTNRIFNSDMSYTNPTVKNFEGVSDTLRIANGLNFKKDGVISCFKQPFLAGKKDVATLDFTDVAGKVGAYRIKTNIYFEDAAAPEWKNDYATNRQNFFIEVMIKEGESASDIVNKVVENFNHPGKLESGVYVPYTLTASGASLKLTCKSDEYRVRSCSIQKYTFKSLVDFIDASGTTVAIDPHDGEFVNQVEASVVHGTSGFGGYKFMIANVMLPTLENLHFGHQHFDENPIPGGKYTQFTITYQAPCKNAGLGIGMSGMTETTHIFWVEEAIVAKFEAAAKAAGITITNAQ